MKNTFRFKTNINCGGCIKAVTPSLDKLAGPQNWKVDTDNPDKILTISTDDLQTKDIINTIQSTGFKIEFIQK
jgi:copper chaperone